MCYIDVYNQLMCYIDVYNQLMCYIAVYNQLFTRLHHWCATEVTIHEDDIIHIGRKKRKERA